MCATVNSTTPILRCISEGDEIVIPATEGKRTIWDAKETFPGGIDSDFKNCSATKMSSAKPDTTVKVYEMVEDATFVQMFGSLSGERKNLCFTHDQIITFCETHHEWLHLDGYATFFLFEVESNFVVARVLSDARDCLYVLGSLFGLADVWSAEHRPRVVVPQL